MPKPYPLGKTEVFMGVDPGASGGLALVGRTAGLRRYVKMPDTVRDLWETVKEWRTEYKVQFAILEKVGGYVGSGQPGSSMFKFGQSYGLLLMSLTAAGIPFEEVTPQKWLKEYSMVKAKEETPTSWKNRLKQKAQMLFPSDIGITLAVCDAILIAEYCRRNRG